MINKIKMLVSQYSAKTSAIHEVKFKGGVTGSQKAAGEIAAYLVSIGCSQDKAVETSVSKVMQEIDPILSPFEMQFNHDPVMYDWSGIVLKKISE